MEAIGEGGVTASGRDGGTSEFYNVVDINKYIRTYGGKLAYIGRGGDGGSTPLITLDELSNVIKQEGNKGNANGGAAIINTYGAGGNKGQEDGNGGYISIVKVDNSVNFYTVTINPIPSDATVEIRGSNGENCYGNGTQSLTVKEGTQVWYSVNRTYYNPQSGNVTVNSNITRDINLEREKFNLNIKLNGNASNSTIKLTANPSTFVDSPTSTQKVYNNLSEINVEVYAGSSVTYQVSKAHYNVVPSNGTISMDGNKTVTISLSATRYSYSYKGKVTLAKNNSETKEYTCNLDSRSWKFYIGGFSSTVTGYKADMRIRIYHNDIAYTEYNVEISKGKSYEYIINNSIKKIEITVTNRVTMRGYNISDIYMELNG